jgi:signal transduction histidine kinase
METKFDHFIAYQCLNAIGNSLDLPVMMTDVIITFMHCTGAIGGQYRETPLSPIISVGEEIRPLNMPTAKETPFFIFCDETTQLLQIPIGEEDLLLLFDHQTDLTSTAMMLSSFRIKLFNAIEACRNIEKLCNANMSLTHQIDIEKHKNETTERLMIDQSRLAIMGEMIGMIAHQWRQPITVIGMLTNNALLDIELGELKTEQLVGDLQSIDKQVHFLSRTIDDFRNFFRPNKLPQSITFEEIESELMTIMGKSFENNRISLFFEGDHDFQLVTYKNELLQVFLNILNNAKDAFMENKTISPVITIALSLSTDTLEFSITDNGGGIKPDILHHIFEPYFSTKSEKNGTGLGLYMSSIIVEKHLQGSLCAASEENTATFTITLPKSIDSKGYNVY